MSIRRRVWVCNQPFQFDDTTNYLLAAVDQGWKPPAGATLDVAGCTLTAADDFAFREAFTSLAQAVAAVGHGWDQLGDPITPDVRPVLIAERE